MESNKSQIIDIRDQDADFKLEIARCQTKRNIKNMVKTSPAFYADKCQKKKSVEETPLVK